MQKSKPYWPMILGPLSTLAVYGIYAVRNQVQGVAWDAAGMAQPWIISRQLLETVALVLLSLAWVIALAHVVARRERLLVLLSVGITLLLLREWHFEDTPLARPTELGVYLGLPAMIILGWFWRGKVTGSTIWPRIRGWLLAAIVAYAWSVIVSRRAFKFLPYEQAMHISFEETAETAGHLLVAWMCVTAWIVPCRMSDVECRR